MSLAGCMENTDCVSKTMSGYHGQECERMSCDATCGPEEELCDAGYDMDGNVCSYRLN